MNEILIIFASITILFALSLLVRSFSKLRFCAICASVFLTWILFLILYWLRIFENSTLISVLMGGSIIGFFYLVEKKSKATFHLFRLPFLLTLFFLAFILLGEIDFLSPLIFLAILWIIFTLIYFFRRNPQMKAIVEKIISCCKNF